ncbi:MAG: response regulator [Pirellulales bacterium]|nr:response regulator [Pirellulales bacterium]
MNHLKKPPILLVDDEPEMLFSLKGLLRREFELFTAESGREAIEILKRQEIHVVMTDQRMPEMTGIELVRRVKNEYPEAIRIVFTGYADIKSVIEAINKGGLYRYITKPWDPDELIEVLQEAAAEYHRIVEGKRLLADIRDYVRHCRELLHGLEARQTGGQAAPEELARLSQAASDLLDRFELFTPLPPAPPGSHS